MPVLPAIGGAAGSLQLTLNSSSAVVVFAAVPGPVMFWRMPLDDRVGEVHRDLRVPAGPKLSCSTARVRSTKPGCVGDVGVFGW